MLRGTTSLCLLLPLACTVQPDTGSNESGATGSGSDETPTEPSTGRSSASLQGTRGASTITLSAIRERLLRAREARRAAARAEAAAIARASSTPPTAAGAASPASGTPPAAAVEPVAAGVAPSPIPTEEVPPLPASTLDELLEVAGSAAGAAPATLPAAGNASGGCDVPPEAAEEDTSRPDRIVGDGSPASCSAGAFIDAVALGGIIRFDCGPDPVVITLDRPAKVVNDAADDVVIDGGGRVTLSGGGKTRILYMNTCDPNQHFTTPHCDNQDAPRLTVQNLTFTGGNSTGELEYAGGGAIWARGGQLKVVNSRFFDNTCVDTGPDVGGGAIRAFSQFENRPIYVVGSTFGGAPGLGNACSNGGGISSINVSWSIYNSLFSHNRALGNGGNPAEAGTPGGGSGGGIYSDGMSNILSVCGTRIEDNAVNAYGSGIFFVNNDHGGSLELDRTVIRRNSGGGWNVLPGVSMHEDTQHVLLDTLLE